MSDTEPTVVITLRLRQSVVMNRGIGNVMENTVLMPDGRMVLDYDQIGWTNGVFTGNVVGEWVMEP